LREGKVLEREGAVEQEASNKKRIEVAALDRAVIFSLASGEAL